MSKSGRKSRHRIPTAALDFRSDAIDERYAAEVERDTGRLERAWRQAQRRLEQAQAKAERVQRTEKQQTRIRSAWAEVEKRLSELHEIEQLMRPGNHASRSHQGRDSFRPAHLGTPTSRSKRFDCPSCGASGAVGADPHQPWCPVSEEVTS